MPAAPGNLLVHFVYGEPLSLGGAHYEPIREAIQQGRPFYEIPSGASGGDHFIVLASVVRLEHRAPSRFRSS